MWFELVTILFEFLINLILINKSFCVRSLSQLRLLNKKTNPIVQKCETVVKKQPDWSKKRNCRKKITLVVQKCETVEKKKANCSKTWNCREKKNVTVQKCETVAKKKFLEKPKGSVRFEEAWKLKRAWNQMAQIFFKKNYNSVHSQL